MKLSNKSQKTYNALVVKSDDKGRMPSLKRVAELLNEAGVDNSAWERETEKLTKAEGMRYYTGGGTRTYKGTKLTVYSERDEEGRRSVLMNLDSTETYYSYNTYNYARDLVKLVNQKLNS